MKSQALYSVILSISFWLICTGLLFAVEGTAGSWLDIPAEYRDEVAEKLEKSKHFTEEQLKIVKECLKQSGIKDTLNCFSDGGLDEAANILVIIRDELGSIKDRICGGSSSLDHNKCTQLQDKTVQLKDDLAAVLSGTIEKGQKYLEERNKLFTMKRKICGKIKEEGCWTWLEERLNLKCNPKKFDKHPEKLEQCQMEVVNDVWERLNTTE